MSRHIMVADEEALIGVDRKGTRTSYRLIAGVTSGLAACALAAVVILKSTSHSSTLSANIQGTEELHSVHTPPCPAGHFHQCPSEWKDASNAGGYHCLHKLARQKSEAAYESSGGACRPAKDGPFPYDDCQDQCGIGAAASGSSHSSGSSGSHVVHVHHWTHHYGSHHYGSHHYGSHYGSGDSMWPLEASHGGSWDGSHSGSWTSVGNGGSWGGATNYPADLPDGELPEGAVTYPADLPDGELPEGAVTYPADLPDGELPDGELPEGAVTYPADLPDGELPEGAVTYPADLPDGELPDGELPEGAVTYPADLPVDYETHAPHGSHVTVVHHHHVVHLSHAGSSYHGSHGYYGNGDYYGHGGSYGDGYYGGSGYYGGGSYDGSYGHGSYYGGHHYGHYGGSGSYHFSHSHSHKAHDEHGIASCGASDARCPASWKSAGSAGGYHCLHQLTTQTSHKAYLSSGGACRPAGHGPFPESVCHAQCRIRGEVRKLDDKKKGIKIKSLDKDKVSKKL